MNTSYVAGKRRIIAALLGLIVLFATLSIGAGDLCAQTPGAGAGPPPEGQTKPQAKPAGDLLQANLDNVSLRDFIRFVSRFTGRNIVYREDVIPNIKVSVFSQEPITEPDLMSMFSEVLASANLASIARGDVLYILPEKQSRDLEHNFTTQPGARGPGEELLTTVYRVRGGMTAKTAEAVLKPLASPFGIVLSIPPASAVLIKDTRTRINNMVKLIRSLETIQPTWRIETLAMTKAKSDSAAKKIAEFYKQLSDHGREMEPPLVMPVEWSNALIVAGDPDQIKNVRMLVQQMDVTGEGTSGLKVYRLQNAKAESAVKVLEGLITSVKAGGAAPGGQPGQPAPGQVASGTYQVSADVPTNSIVVLGDADFIAKVDEIMLKLDRPLDQVYVQALIMETTLSNVNQFGVEWVVGGGDKNFAALGGFLTPNSNGTGLSPLVTSVASGVSTANPLNALAGGFNLGVLGNTISFNGVKFPTLGALINALKTANGVNILSTPQIMTLDNAQAEVFVGSNVPYLTSQQTNTANSALGVATQIFDYRDVGVRLKVVPHINPQSGLVRLDIEQEVKQLAPGSVANQPTTLSRTTKTSVQLLDGSTMVISGLIGNNNTLDRRSVPGVGDVPILGWLFKNKTDNFDKTTLMVFITARIIKTQLQADALSKFKMDENERFRQQTQDAVTKEFGTRSVFDDAASKSLDPKTVIESFEAKPGEGPFDLQTGSRTAAPVPAPTGPQSQAPYGQTGPSGEFQVPPRVPGSSPTPAVPMEVPLTGQDQPYGQPAGAAPIQ